MLDKSIQIVRIYYIEKTVTFFVMMECEKGLG
jgi:hypothetical protein